MAQYTLNAGCYFRPYRSGKGSAAIRSFQCSTAVSSATIKVGWPVTTDTKSATTSAFRICRPKIATSNSLLDYASDKLVGIALEADPSSGSTAGMSDIRTKNIPVALADGRTEFLGWCYGNGVVESTMIGQTKGVLYDSTLGMWFIDSTNSTAALHTVTITDVPDYALGSTNGPVVFRFLSSLVGPLAKA